MKIGFIDYYLDEWHANNYPAWIREQSGGEMVVTCAFGLIDSPIGGRTTEKWCADMGIHRAESIEEVIAECDGLIVLSPDNCEMHEQLCALPLASGKPTYVDKTFAPDLDAAKRIFAMADAGSTPCWSTSALRFAEEYADIRDVKTLASWGPNGFETYSIHQLEPIVMLMRGEPARVMALRGDGWYTMNIEFADGRAASLTGYEAGSPFMMNAVTGGGAKVVEVKSDFFAAFIRALVDFFRDSTKIVPRDETLRIMAVRTAGLKALESPGTWIPVE